jgi:splicing factor 3B subunit 3
LGSASLNAAAALTLAPCVAVADLHLAGNFTAPRQQEVVVGKGKVLELLRPDESGRLVTVLSTEVFGLVRSLLAFRLFGGDRDYLVVGSDAGRLAILEYDGEGHAWRRVHLETYGKTGMRRITPGQYLAADPKGRAIMVAALEKQKLAYVMSRVAGEPLTISSPLEAHRGHALVFDLVGCDVGFENPIFASLEVDYGDVDEDATGEAAANVEKQLVYYELDLGLNHVTRKWSRATDRGANALIPLPGGADGPGGVLVLAENWVLY